MQKRNDAKAKKIFDAIEGSNGFYKCPVAPAVRSVMNIPFTMATPELEKEFLKACDKRGLMQLKGHRSVGGIRASVYNAMPDEGVDALVSLMKVRSRDAAGERRGALARRCCCCARCEAARRLEPARTAMGTAAARHNVPLSRSRGGWCANLTYRARRSSMRATSASLRRKTACYALRPGMRRAWASNRASSARGRATEHRSVLMTQNEHNVTHGSLTCPCPPP